eukprot:XP_025000333.1 uncharacterized protein LOC112530482 [Gallus gallus]
MEAWDNDAVEAVRHMAFPVIYTSNPAGGMQATITALDWKLLLQLRSTVSQFGVKSEPAKQMLDYIWSMQILLLSNCQAIAKLIFSQHQQLLFNAYWQELCHQSVSTARQPGDPLHGVTLEELLGLGPFFRTEAQALLGPDKCRETMYLARQAMDKIKVPGGLPFYMGIRQGRDEDFGAFIDKVAGAIEKAGVPEYMRGVMLKECALQNCNSTARSILNTLRSNWTIEEALEKLSSVPVRPQAFLVEAIKELGAGLKAQAEASHNQVLAALAPLQASATTNLGSRSPVAGRIKCYRCGGMGHMRRQCQATGSWCQTCRMDNYNTNACRCWSGNPQPSARKKRRLRADTSSRFQPAAALQPATPGSLSLDLAAAVTTTLMTTKPERVSTGIRGPVMINGTTVGALLLGRSSASMLGLFVLPGVIDADFQGEIQIMVYTPFPPIKIEKGQRIAQLVPLEQLTKALTPCQSSPRGEQGFGSSGGLALLSLNLRDRPKKTVTLKYREEEIKLQGLDTGADSSIVSPEIWPPHWPLQAAIATVTGIGGLSLAKKSPPLQIHLDEQVVHTSVSVAPLPPTLQCLIGRNVLSQLGALQPGLPNPAMLPYNWPLLIIDLKDCFFTITLHPEDTKRFAFTLPALNREHPDQRFEWTVLPQGMKNSPTLCQLYVDHALQPLRREWKQMVIYHYMDDILFAQPEAFTQEQIWQIEKTLNREGLMIAPEKVQLSAPRKYLGWAMTNTIVTPQKLQLNTEIETLHDAQRLLGDLQWLRPVVGIPNELLESLRPFLQGTDPAQPVTVTTQHKRLLQQIIDCIIHGSVRRCDPDLPIQVMVWYGPKYLLGALAQSKKKTGEVWVLEWICPSLQQSKTLLQKTELLAEVTKKGRERTLQITGMEPVCVQLSVQKDTLTWYVQHSPELQDALLRAGSMVSMEKIPNVSLHWIGQWSWLRIPKRPETPLQNAITAYTDAGRKSRTAAVTWQQGGSWRHHLIVADDKDSLQTLELVAVVWAMMNLIDPLFVVTDSLYVAGVCHRIEEAYIKKVQNLWLYELFVQLQRAIRIREHSYAVVLVRGHKWEIDLGEGNARADRLVSLAQRPLVSQHVLAREAHSMFHQNAKGLRREFQITYEDAKAIVRLCPVCSHHNGGMGLGLGVSPRGLKANENWQMDVTHVGEFGQLKYVHVSIDTYSHFMWATAQSGEKAMYVERHLSCCFAVMGISLQIKTDNGPAYTSRRLGEFLQTWGVKHSTGIPNSPTGQAIVERGNCGWTADPARSCFSPPGSVQVKQLLWITVSHRTMMGVGERNAELR